ncbi:heparinase II/III domain-containing protein [Erysipelothrix sp. strain 2 (EsS2-6-Brazil)]|uniref:heparinase II/III domain-containing protein n=1 Tax=Erysipelothrix sp. strain 2 (EsS2-6-Brazil) TaxID=2500549 RepID=UPI00190DF53D|nr:heparinase II/III family protein [Erysipelothrix sp. strain 2 (EsS2-6-Brazil)]MBK2402883.1 alginate lyase family protein [Erysipelothrix sp. strain 2 (EsS2-6-Brazil)]
MVKNSLYQTIEHKSNVLDLKRLKSMYNFKEKEVVAYADQLMMNIFTFTRDWDMEPCDTPYTLNPFGWTTTPNGDDEWIFMLNRMDYLPSLVMATVLTDDLKYINHAKDRVLHWIDEHTPLTSGPSTRTLDTAMRMNNWLDLCPYLKAYHLLDEDVFARIQTSLETQANYLKEHYLTKYTLSNWGSIQTCVLAKYLGWLKHDADTDFKTWVHEEIQTQFEIQVYPDGMHWEQSTMYHVEVLNYGLKALPYVKDQEGFKQTLDQMAYALYYQATPQGDIVAFGDSDRTVLGGILGYCAVALQNPMYKSKAHDVLDFEVCYAYGVMMQDAFEALETEVPVSLNYDGVDSGIFTTRSDWGSDAHFTMFTNGSLGSGHGHADNLHVSTYFQGKPVLVDPGRLTYREDDPRRMHLKGMESHNTVILDGKPSAIPDTSWTYASFYKPLKNYVRHEGNCHYYEGVVVSDASVHQRKLIVIDDGIWMIVDEVKAEGNHVATTKYHLDESLLYQNGIIKFEDESKLNVLSTSPITVASDVISYTYNKASTHSVLVQEQDFVDACVNVTLFVDPKWTVTRLPILQNGETPIADERGCAYAFENDDEVIEVCVLHEEIWQGKKIMYCNGKPFHAKCVVRSNRFGQKVMRA